MSDTQHLSPSDRLSLAIGRTCQADVRLEQTLVFVFRALAMPGLGAVVPPHGFDQLVTSCRKMLGLADLPAEWNDAARDALSAATHAHKVRNRYVHDIWMGDIHQRDTHHFLQTTYDRQGLGARTERRRIDVIERAADEIRVATTRVHFLAMAIPYLMGIGGSDPSLVTPDMIKFVQGQFVTLPDGGVRVVVDDANDDEVGQ